MMRKLMIIATVSALALGLFGCSLNGPKGLPMTWYDRDYDKANEIMERILAALDNKDKEELKAMFSKVALEEAVNIDAGIDYIMEFYQGTVQEFKGTYNTSERIKLHQNMKQLTARYTVTTDKDIYRIRFVYKVTDDVAPESIGLYMLQIIRNEERVEGFRWASDQAGVYIPEEVSK